MRKLSIILCLTLLINIFTYPPVDALDPMADIDILLPDMGIRVNFLQESFGFEEGETSCTLKMTLNRPSSETLSFDYKTQDGSAVSGVEYQTLEGAVVFSPGETIKTLDFQFSDPAKLEITGEKVFFVNFFNIQNGLFEGDVTQERVSIKLIHGTPVDVETIGKLQKKNLLLEESVDAEIRYDAKAYSIQNEVILSADFSEPVIQSGVMTMNANGVELFPEELVGTVSQSFTFVYPIQEADFVSGKAYDIEILVENINNVARATDEKVFDGVQIANPLIGLEMIRDAQAYLHDMTVSFSHDELMNLDGHIEMKVYNFKYVIENLMKRIFNRNDVLEYNDEIYFQVLGSDGTEVDVDMFYNDTDAYLMTGEFTLPVNKTGYAIDYLVRLVVDDGIDPSQYAYFTTESAIMVDDESDLQIDYVDWPPNNKIKIREGLYRQLGYTVRDDATWSETDDFVWTSSDSNVASIDQNGLIEIKKEGSVAFTLTALNDSLPESTFSITTPILTVRELEKPYISIVDEDETIITDIHEDMEIAFGSNLTEHNFVTDSLDSTEFTVRLYAVEHYENHQESHTLLFEETLASNIVDPVSSYVIDGFWLDQIAPFGYSNYAIEIEAEQASKGKLYSDLAYIQVKSPSAEVYFEGLDSYSYDDEKGAIDLPFSMINLDTSNTLIESEMEVVINGEKDAGFSQSGFAGTAGTLTINPRTVPEGTVREQYDITVKVRNNESDAFSYDTLRLYVFNHDALMMTVEGLPTEYTYMSNVDAISQMSVEEILALNRDIKLRSDIGSNVGNYPIYGPDNNSIWTMDNAVVISIRDRDLVNWITAGAEYTSEDVFYLFGDADGTANVELRHKTSHLTGNLQVEVDNLKDQLYLFDNVQDFRYTMRYTNGEGERVETTSAIVYDGKTAIYEEYGIVSDVVISYIDGEDLYRRVIKHGELLSGEGTGAIKSVYPINTFDMETINDTELTISYDHNQLYSGKIQLLGGVYVDGVYQEEMLINGKGRYVEQLITVVDGKFVLKVDPVRLERVHYQNNIEVKLQIRDVEEAFYPIFDGYGGINVQSFSEMTHVMEFTPYLLNRADHSIFDEYQVINQKFMYDNEYSDFITKDVDYLYVDKLNQKVTVSSQILIPKVTNNEDVTIEAFVMTINNGKVALPEKSCNLSDGDYPFANLQIYDFEYEYYETNSDMKIESGGHYPVQIGITIQTPGTPTSRSVSYGMHYQLLNLISVKTVYDTYGTKAEDYYNEIKGYIDIASYIRNECNEVPENVYKLFDNMYISESDRSRNKCAFVIEPGDGLLHYDAVLAFALDDKTNVMDDYGIETYFYDVLEIGNPMPPKSVSSLRNALDPLIASYSISPVPDGSQSFKASGYGYIVYEIFYDVLNQSWECDLKEYNTTVSGSMKKVFSQEYYRKKFKALEKLFDLMVVDGTTTLSAIVNYNGALKEYTADGDYDYIIKIMPTVIGSINYTAKVSFGNIELKALAAEGGVSGTATVRYTHQYYQSDDPDIEGNNSGKLTPSGTVDAYAKGWVSFIKVVDENWELLSFVIGPFYFPNQATWDGQVDDFINASRLLMASESRLLSMNAVSQAAFSSFDDVPDEILDLMMEEAYNHGNVQSFAVDTMGNGQYYMAYTVMDSGVVNLTVAGQNAEILSDTTVLDYDVQASNADLASVTMKNGMEVLALGHIGENSMGEKHLYVNFFNQNGEELTAMGTNVKWFGGTGFSFSENAESLDDLYVTWHSMVYSSSTGQDGDAKINLNDVMFACKFVDHDEPYLSYPMSVVTLPGNEFFGDHQSISQGDHIRLVYETKSSVDGSTQYEMKEATRAIDNSIKIESVKFEQSEVYANNVLPMEFTVLNCGYDELYELEVKLQENAESFIFTEGIKPGDAASVIVNYSVDDLVKDVDCTTTGIFRNQAANDHSVIALGSFILDVSKVELIKDSGKERSYYTEVSSLSQKKLSEGEHVVRLGVYDRLVDLSNPVYEVVLDTQEALDQLMDQSYSTIITLDDELIPYLNDTGDIPEEQIKLYVIARVETSSGDILEENKKIIYVKSLLDQSNGETLTCDSIIGHDDQESLDIRIFNNSMNDFTGIARVYFLNDRNEVVDTVYLNEEDNHMVTIEGESSMEYHLISQSPFTNYSIEYLQ